MCLLDVEVLNLRGFLKGGETMLNVVRKSRVVILLLIILLCAVSYASQEEVDEKAGFPDRPINLVIPFASGSGMDVAARILASSAAGYFPVPVRIINMPGAGSTLGTSYVWDQKRDGYNLVSMIDTSFLYSIINLDVPFDVEDWEAVMQYAIVGFVLGVRQDSPWKTFSELIEYIKEHPGEVTVSTGGVGSSAQLFLSVLTEELGLDIVEIPYESGSDSTYACVRGEVDVVSQGTVMLKPLSEEGILRILAISQDQRDPIVPEVPTMIEEGYDFKFMSARVILVPKGIPRERIEFLEAAFLELLEDPSLRALAKKLGLQVLPRGSADTNEQLYYKYEQLKKLALQ